MPNKVLAVLVLGLGVSHAVPAAEGDFQPEPLGQVAALPETYPDHWVVVHDLSFTHMREGKLFIVNPAGETVGTQLKGIVSADFIASFLHSARRNEHYVVESFHARGGRGGARTDVVTIYKPGSLQVAAEVVIPPKRLTGMPNRYQVALLDDDRYLVVYNFTPAQTVSVVDLEKRQFLGEVGIPGCAFTYPTGRRGFSSLCSDGGMLTTHLGADGTVADTVRVPPFNEVVDDPLFEKPAFVGGTAYFPSFSGDVLPVDLSGEQPELGERWSLTSPEDRAAGWRPGGAWPAVGDRDGRLYVLMHGHGAEGSHKDGGDEVWVFDAAQGERVARFELANWGIAISVSGGSEQQLFVSGAEPVVDVYDRSGRHLKTLGISASTPLLVHGLR